MWKEDEGRKNYYVNFIQNEQDLLEEHVSQLNGMYEKKSTHQFANKLHILHKKGESTWSERGELDEAA